MCEWPVEVKTMIRADKHNKTLSAETFWSETGSACLHNRLLQQTLLIVFAEKHIPIGFIFLAMTVPISENRSLSLLFTSDACVPEVFLIFLFFAKRRIRGAQHSIRVWLMEKEIQAGFSGEDFNDATSSRFDGGDSSFPENLQEKRPRPNAQNYFAFCRGTP